MGELTVKEWKRYGKERLYITDAAGENVGYYDRQTSQLHVDDPEMRYRALEALAPFLGGDISALAGAVDLTPPMPHMDLTNNVAGGAVSARAAELSPGRFQRIAAKILGIRTEATSWEVGAAGERRVGNRLDRLKSRGWNVLHSVPLKSGADIDHIVIGPGGVFTVNTKHHPGARVTCNQDFVRVNGQLNHYVRNSRHEASTAARRLSSACRLSIQVTGVVAFVGVHSLNVKEPPADVLVVVGDRLEWLFLRAPQVLSVDMQQRIYAVARRGELWLA